MNESKIIFVVKNSPVYHLDYYEVQTLKEKNEIVLFGSEILFTLNWNNYRKIEFLLNYSLNLNKFSLMAEWVMDYLYLSFCFGKTTDFTVKTISCQVNSQSMKSMERFLPRFCSNVSRGGNIYYNLKIDKDIL